ncbi:MAG TPA: 3-deoxy-7-phosphoheptulonate synthase [Candidatus Eisenbacteria bacterium]|jgi:3-deoxy-7-phosphoheptulonate synthase|nr:3-deoxy-7-phosphoheptulonate synthase [Candidatus Eisenbacteria bacterium]
MVIVLHRDATPEQRHTVEARLRDLGFQVVYSPNGTQVTMAAVGEGTMPPLDEMRSLPGVEEVRRIPSPFKLASRAFRKETTVVRVGDVEIGGKSIILMAGPCTIESEEQLVKTGAAVRAAGARIMRGGAFKPRTSPYSFQGLGEEGLKLMRRVADMHGLLVISEVMDKSQIALMDKYVDIFQVGARNMQNYPLLRDLGSVERPVLVKRGLAATVDEWLMSAEYVMSGGNDRVLVCERGIRAYETYTRNTLDLNAVAVAKSLSHLPVIVDPSHAAGIRDKVPPLARAAVAAGADGLLVEVHYDPESAICDGPQSLFPDQFAELTAQIRMIAEAVGRTL